MKSSPKRADPASIRVSTPPPGRVEGATAPLSSGTLGEVPIVYALASLRNARSSGLLEVKGDDGRSASVAFWRGLVASASSSPSVARFGSVAYEMGIIGPSMLDSATIESSRTRRTQEEILIERQAVSDVHCAVLHAEQLKRRAHWLFTFSNASTFAFQPLTPSPSEPKTSIDPIDPMWRGLVDFPPERRVREVLEYVGDRSVRITNDNALGNAGLSPRELALCEMLARGPMNMQQIRIASQLRPARVDLLVYFLSLARCIEIQDAPRTRTSSGTEWAAGAAPSSPPPTSLTMPPAAMRSMPPGALPLRSMFPPSVSAASAEPELELELAVEPRATMFPRGGPA